MLFDLTFPCYLTTFSGKKCLSGKIICATICPAYRSNPVYLLIFRVIQFSNHAGQATSAMAGVRLGRPGGVRNSGLGHNFGGKKGGDPDQGMDACRDRGLRPTSDALS
jgi:hypothetical protein